MDGTVGNVVDGSRASHTCELCCKLTLALGPAIVCDVGTIEQYPREWKQFCKLAGHPAVAVDVLRNQRKKYPLKALWLVPADEQPEFHRLLKLFVNGGVVRYFPRGGKRKTRTTSWCPKATAHSFAYYLDTREPAIYRKHKRKQNALKALKENMLPIGIGQCKITVI